MNNELKFGLYGGLSFILWCLLEFFTGLHNDHMNVAQYTEMAGGFIPWIFIYTGIRYRKRVLQNGKLTFGEGVRSGMVISLVSSIVITSFLYLYVNVINTGYNKVKIDFMREQLLKANLKPEVFNQQMEGFNNMYSGTFLSHLTLTVSFASLGIVIAAVISLFLKTKKTTESL